MNFDEQLAEAFEAATNCATEYWENKTPKVFNGLYLIVNFANLLANEFHVYSFKEDFHIYSFTSKEQKKWDDSYGEFCIYQTVKEIHTLDDLKENFKIMSEIGRIKLKEFHIKQQKEELEREFNEIQD